MFTEPNTFPVPNELVDSAMKHCTTTELCVLLVVVRQTWGFRKMWDYLSISQITKKANISRQGARNAARVLEKKGYIKSQYVCHKCLAVLPAKYFPRNHGKKEGKSKPPKCPRCASFTPPEKWYALNVKGDEITQYLKESLNITAIDRGVNTQLTGGVNSVDRGVNTQLTHNKYSYNKQYTKNKKKEEDPVYNSLQAIEEPNLQIEQLPNGVFVPKFERTFEDQQEEINYQDLVDCGIKPKEKAKAIIVNNRTSPGLVQEGIGIYVDNDEWQGPQYLIGVLKNIGVVC